MERVPCVVIGAGVVGLAIGRALSQSGLMTLVLEKNSLFGAENSSRNSEVLHAGLYYTPGSNKANMCRTGKHMMLDYLKERNVPYNQCGKLVVASTDSEIPILHKIMKNGQQNGLTDLKLLNEEDIKVLEPLISCKAAMLSPFTGVFDSHTLMLNCVGDIEDSGSSIVYNCTVEKVSLDKNVSYNRSSHKGFEVHTSQGTIYCDTLINAAGMYAPYITSQMDFYPKYLIPPVYYAKGNYFHLQNMSLKDTPFHHLIYPIPQYGGLGVHATLDLHGNIKFGPNVEWLQYKGDRDIGNEDPYKFPANVLPPNNFNVNLYTTTTTATNTTPATTEEETVDVFCREIRQYWPAVHRDLLAPDYAGIRPKLCGPATSSSSSSSSSTPSIGSTSVGDIKLTENNNTTYTMPASTDFSILTEKHHHIPGLVCLYGIESPGLTASFAIAEYVKQQQHLLSSMTK